MPKTEASETLNGKSNENSNVAANGTSNGDANRPDKAATSELEQAGGNSIKPPGWDRTGWEALRHTVYNPDTGEVFTRTPLSWLKIILFYTVYYTCLAGFWIGCLQVFFQTLPDVSDGPRWMQDESIIGVNPGLGLRPGHSDQRINSNMFLLKEGDTNSYPSARDGEGELNADYAHRVQLFLDQYNNSKMAEMDPVLGRMGENKNGAYPEFDVAALGPCANFPYGYVGAEVAPCIYVKLNRIWGWRPEPYNCTEAREEGGDCPGHLERLMETQEAGEADGVMIDCVGRFPADREALGGPGGLHYFPPSQTLPGAFFPYEGRARGNYHQPVVAVQVRPAARRQLLHIECRAYYRGVRHVTKTREGMVQFELQIL